MSIDWHDSLEWLCKLLLAAVLGGAIGFERESHGQSAGFRTNILVSVGACLMMMLSLNMERLFHQLDHTTVVRLDPGRIASYAIASMGFLGAGAIIKGKGSVRGLTTAAALWLVTGVGLSVGAGYYLPAAYTTGISLLILYNLRFFKFLFSHDIFTILNVTCVRSQKPLHHILKILTDYPNIEIRFINFKHNLTEGFSTYHIRLCSSENLPWNEIVKRLTNEVSGVVELGWEESDVP